MRKTIRSLWELFRDLEINSGNYLKIETGKDFESKIRTSIDDFVCQLFRDDLNNQEKEKLRSLVVENKHSENDIKNPFPEYTKRYIYQPFGSQNYPDFIIFWKEYLIPIEVKFSLNASNSKPVWNSNLPKYEGFYIFGNSGSKQLTFFKGQFVLTKEERRKLVDFWQLPKQIETQFEKDLTKSFHSNELSLEYGFSPYIRVAYEQTRKMNKRAITNFFQEPQRQNIQKKTLLKIREYQK